MNQTVRRLRTTLTLSLTLTLILILTLTLIQSAELNKGANKFTVDPEDVCYSTFSLKDLDHLEDDDEG